MVKERIDLVYGKEQYLFKIYCNKNATVHGKSTLNLVCEKIVLISDYEVKFWKFLKILKTGCLKTMSDHALG